MTYEDLRYPMADVYVQLGLLGRRLEEIDAQVAELRDARASLELEIKALASQLVAGDPPTPALSATQRKSNGPTLSAAELALPPRYVRLLSLLAENPGSDVAQLARRVYGKADKTSRINVSSDFSRLKSDGFVAPVRRGEFRLTDKGTALFSGGSRP